MRVETIGDDGVIDGVKKGVLCCAMSEMPFGQVEDDLIFDLG